MPQHYYRAAPTSRPQRQRIDSAYAAGLAQQVVELSDRIEGIGV